MNKDEAEKLAVALGAAIRRARRNHDLTQIQLSALIGVEQTRLSRWELGKVAPDLFERVDLERALGLRTGDLLIDAGLLDLPAQDTERAIRADPDLDDNSRAVMLDFYRSALEMTRATRSWPQRKNGRGRRGNG